MKAVTAKLASDWERRGRVVLGVLIALGAVGAFLLGSLLRPPGPEGSAVDIELAKGQKGFATALARGWREDSDAWCGFGANYQPDGQYFGTLRCHLLVDSVALVPGYVGLLVFFTMALSRVGGVRSALLIHILCVPAIAAGLFDIAENGMTITAAEDLMNNLLADETVRDVRLASLCKWWLVAASFGLLAALAWRAAIEVRKRADRMAWPLQVAAAAAALTSIVLGVGIALMGRSALDAGMLLAVFTFAWLAWWRLKKFESIATGALA